MSRGRLAVARDETNATSCRADADRPAASRVASRRVPRTQAFASGAFIALLCSDSDLFSPVMSAAVSDPIRSRIT